MSVFPLAAFPIACLLAWAVMPLVIRVAWAIGYLDHPEARKLHTNAMQVLGGATAPDAVEVRWPGGRLTAQPVPEGAREITIRMAP